MLGRLTRGQLAFDAAERLKAPPIALARLCRTGDSSTSAALDSRGDIYVGEVSYTDWPTTHPDVPMPKGLRSLQKLQKVK